jgi:hypothetical protein
MNRFSFHTAQAICFEAETAAGPGGITSPLPGPRPRSSSIAASAPLTRRGDTGLLMSNPRDVTEADALKLHTSAW